MLYVNQNSDVIWTTLHKKIAGELYGKEARILQYQEFSNRTDAEYEKIGEIEKKTYSTYTEILKIFLKTQITSDADMYNYVFFCKKYIGSTDRMYFQMKVVEIPEFLQYKQLPWEVLRGMEYSTKKVRFYRSTDGKFYKIITDFVTFYVRKVYFESIERDYEEWYNLSQTKYNKVLLNIDRLPLLKEVILTQQRKRYFMERIKLIIDSENSKTVKTFNCSWDLNKEIPKIVGKGPQKKKYLFVKRLFLEDVIDIIYSYDDKFEFVDITGGSGIILRLLTYSK